MKILIVLLLSSLTAYSQAVSIKSFNLNQFATNSLRVAIKSAAEITNLNVSGFLTLGNTNRYIDDGSNLTRNGVAVGSGGGGGDTVLTNISGTIQPAPGQVTNRFSFTSGAADNATNVAFKVDTTNLWVDDDALLGVFSTAGTNRLNIRKTGSLGIGQGVDYWLGSNPGAFQMFWNTAQGEPNGAAIVVGVTDEAVGNFWSIDASLSQMSLFADFDGTVLASLNPTVVSTGSAVAHFLDTYNVLTNGDSVFQVRNQGVIGLNVTASGAITGRLPVDYGFALSDETSALTTSTNAVRIQLPHAMTLTGVFASVTTAQSSGSIVTCDLKKNGTTMLSTLVTIDNNETGSNTAAAAPVVSVTSIAQYDILVVSITQVGTGGAGLKFWITGYR